jgi:dihydrolipoamide dehydrogenase
MLLLQKQMELLKLSKRKNIIATGSKPSSLPFIKIDKERIITSTEALKLRGTKTFVYWWWSYRNRIRSEVYLRLGAQVSVVEYLDRIIPGMDASLSKELTKVLKKQGMKFYVSHKVKSVERNGEGVVVQAAKRRNYYAGRRSLVSVGRRPYTDGLNADKAGVKISDRGMVEVNDHLQTSVPISMQLAMLFVEQC